MRISAICLTAVTVAALSGALAGAGPSAFGAGVTLATPTPLATVAARPGEFLGKAVRVDGVVTAVCEVAGCWMALVAPDNPKGATVRFKVEDGVIVFPLSARGRRASAQGVVERIGSDDAHSREAAAEHAQHATAEQATPANMPWHVRATGRNRLLSNGISMVMQVRDVQVSCEI